MGIAAASHSGFYIYTRGWLLVRGCTQIYFWQFPGHCPFPGVHTAELCWWRTPQLDDAAGEGSREEVGLRFQASVPPPGPYS